MLDPKPMSAPTSPAALSQANAAEVIEQRDPSGAVIARTSLLGGVLAVCVVAYLSAVYLVHDAQRVAEADMVSYFRNRASGRRTFSSWP